MTPRSPKLILLFIISLSVVALLCVPRSVRRAEASAGAPTSPAAAAAAQMKSPAEGGSWEPLQATRDVPVHLSLLPDGRLLYWGRDKEGDGWDATGHSNTYTVDPLYLDNTDYTAIPQPTPPTNLFCSGHSFLPDGRLLVTGGHIKDSGEPKRESIGEKAINIFDYRTSATYPSGNWTHMPPEKEMERGRWYPYNITMPSGETLIIAGGYRTNTTYPITTDDNKEPSLRNLQGNVSTLRQNVLAAPRVYKYPYISLTPNGKVFIAKPSTTQFGDQSLYFDPYMSNDVGSFGVFTNGPSPQYHHYEGTSVMYAQGKMLLIGGSNGGIGTPNVAAVESIDLNQTSPAPGWSQISSLAQPRQYPTATLLPDGEVLVTGGTSCGGVNRLNCGPNGTYGGAVQTPELWDPANPSAGWQQMNATTSGVPRVYHSVAMLLPDGRVLVGGGGLPAAAGETPPSGVPCAGTGPEDTEECRKLGHKDVEIFSPPYLYNADSSRAIRPAIASAPDSIAYGQQFQINVGNVSPSTISKVVLIRLPSVTHTYNQDQRRVDLGAPVAYDSTYVWVQAPADGTACPPGPYMMFLISNNGRNTPSVAKIVRVGDYSISGTSQSFTGAGGSGTISINAQPGTWWLATSNNPSWVTITSANTGSGSATISFSVAPNTGSGAVKRSTTITVKPTGSREAQGLTFGVYQAIDFTDVPASSPFNRFISALYARDITAGCGGNNYCPGVVITRAQAAVFLTQIVKPYFDVPNPAPGGAGYTDVGDTYFYRKFISYIKRRGIATQCGAGLFCPDRGVTRRDMIVWTIRAMGIDNPPIPSSPPFRDVPVSDAAAPYIAEAARRNLTVGCGDGYFCPDREVNRGEMAVFLAVAFGL